VQHPPGSAEQGAEQHEQREGRAGEPVQGTPATGAPGRSMAAGALASRGRLSIVAAQNRTPTLRCRRKRRTS
jgi:hypothetical protein